MKKSGKLNGTSGHAGRGRAAVAQARLILLVMVNVAQLWILAATVEAALAHRFRVTSPGYRLRDLLPRYSLAHLLVATRVTPLHQLGLS